jgi:hypothetical protein
VALTPAFVDAHIAHWQQQLTSPYYPHRKHWPGRLFHHAPIENAVAILRDGNLRSRNDSANMHPIDVAAPGVIDARTHAHDRVRLYFRPKTPTQWHIEGIRRDGECTYGMGSHAPVLVMFGLDARSILCRPDIRFSNRNMQLNDTVAGDDEAYFADIPFAKVYSEGGTGGDRSVIDARCAEVLPTSPLPLDECLRAIYLRSEPERDMLLHMLGNARGRWEKYCRVSDALKVFQKEYSFVQDLRLTSDGVIFRINPRQDRRNIAIKIDVWDAAGTKRIDFFNSDHEPHPKPPASTWIYRKKLADGRYLVEVRLENCLAYRGHFDIGDSLF